MSKPVCGGICLYGNRDCGLGWLAYVGELEDGRMFGDGEPKDGKSATDALWLACAALRDAGCEGDVQVFAAGGRRMAVCSVTNPPYFGDLVWGPARVYMIPVDAINAAAEHNFRVRFQGRGGSWHGWQLMTGTSAEDVRSRVASSELCGDWRTIQVEAIE